MYKCKYSRLRVKTAIWSMARQLKKKQLITEDTIFLVMLDGGMWFASRLFACLGDIPNEVYYIKGHSYKGQQRKGMTWDLLPDVDLSGRDVVIIDDICDSGATLRAAYNQLHHHTKSFTAVTLLHRKACQDLSGISLYACIEDDSKDFFVGCGLDDNGKSRLLRYIGIC